MKLTIKTLQQLTFKVDIELDKTVKDLKELIEREQGIKEHPSAAQKLIYNGKILVDENKLSEYDFDEKKFIVLMITRPPPAPKPTTTTIPETSSTASKQKSEEKPKPPSTRPSQQTTTATTTTSTTSSSVPTTSTSTTTTSTTTQSRNDSTGSEQLPSARDPLSLDYSSPAPSLSALMTHPHFRQMQDLIQQSPHLLSSTIESLATSDPDMYNFISENPDVFVSALNHPPLAGVRSGNPSPGQRQPSQSRGGSQQAIAVQGGGGSRPVMDQLLGDVSEHDREAIERLKELGFSEYLAVQAYMACDKDEQLAANLLFQMDQ